MSSLILASGSPRRSRLLDAAGYQFTVQVPAVDESELAGEAPEELVRRLARRKASAVAGPDALVLGADTIVVLDGEVLGKPRHAADAETMLARLSGRAHRVLTGWCVSGSELVIGHDETTVVFRPLSVTEIRAYVATGEPMDKAGAYAIQGGASGFVISYEGLYDNIIGLPVASVARVLSRFGIEPIRRSS